MKTHDPQAPDQAIYPEWRLLTTKGPRCVDISQHRDYPIVCEVVDAPLVYARYSLACYVAEGVPASWFSFDAALAAFAAAQTTADQSIGRQEGM